MTNDITHCVTATLGTEKTHRANMVKGARVVWVGWFWKSVALWQKQEEEEWLAVQSHDPGPGSTNADGSGLTVPGTIVDEPGQDGEEEEGEKLRVWDTEDMEAIQGDMDAIQGDVDAWLEGSSDVDATEDGRTDVERWARSRVLRRRC